jgi:hypothetical protein
MKAVIVRINIKFVKLFFLELPNFSVGIVLLALFNPVDADRVNLKALIVNTN